MLRVYSFAATEGDLVKFEIVQCPLQRSNQNTPSRYPVRISIKQLSRRGRRARFPKRLREAYSHLFALKSFMTQRFNGR
jgi:hypothetical protein